MCRTNPDTLIWYVRVLFISTRITTIATPTPPIQNKATTSTTVPFKITKATLILSAGACGVPDFCVGVDMIVVWWLVSGEVPHEVQKTYRMYM